ncbi:hypothetical protein Hanom_Chr06g00563581 [Helianthus anomalus]
MNQMNQHQILICIYCTTTIAATTAFVKIHRHSCRRGGAETLRRLSLSLSLLLLLSDLLLVLLSGITGWRLPPVSGFEREREREWFCGVVWVFGSS